jgi:molybdenum cofactor cytidylyltransferase
MELGGVILAAGASTRFGDQPKLLAGLDDRPVLEHVIGAACSVPELERVVVVLGGDAELLRESIDFGRAEPVLCDDWQRGMSWSLRCGVAALAHAERVMVLLGDSPTVTPDLLRRFVNALGGTRAAYRGVPGHPVVLGRAQIERLEDVRGDIGARRLLEDGPRIECADIASGEDIDTVADLDRLQDSARVRDTNDP